MLAARGKEVQGQISQLRDEISLYETAIEVLSKIGEERQNTVQTQIESLVTQGLQTVFGSELSFHIIQSQRGKMATVEFIVRSTLDDGREIDTDVMAARGGGLAAVIGFLLRLVVILLSPERGVRRILFLDETFAHLSKEYVPLMADFLRELVDKTDIQLLLVTHQDEFIDSADKCYRFSLGADGWTEVERL